MAKKILTESDKHEIFRRYEEGDSVAEIARNFDISKSTVSVVAKQYGKSRNPRLTEEQKKLIIDADKIGYHIVSLELASQGRWMTKESVRSLHHYYKKNYQS